MNLLAHAAECGDSFPANFWWIVVVLIAVVIVLKVVDRL